MEQRDRFRGCLLGLAAGDAVGTAVEFRTRGTFEPLSDMVGGGVFGLAAGQWTDDTSMALCLATSLVERGGFDARDQMERYCAWQEHGTLSSTGTCFDIGRTIAGALGRFRQNGEPYAGSTDPHSAGNGCIMRLAPVPMFFASDLEAAERHAADSARTTHGAAECIDACRLLARVLCRALRGAAKDEVAFGDARSFAGEERIVAIARGDYHGKPVGAIRGTGYVVESLEAALWCFTRAGMFEEAVLMAANLGDDADTTAAVCGQVAGAYWGAPGIPARWVERLALRAEITRLADELYRSAEARRGEGCEGGSGGERRGAANEEEERRTRRRSGERGGGAARACGAGEITPGARDGAWRIASGGLRSAWRRLPGTSAPRGRPALDSGSLEVLGLLHSSRSQGG